MTNTFPSEVPPPPAVAPRTSGTNQINVGNVERLLSIGGGLALTVLGIRNFRQSTAGGLALTLGGGFLLYRGASGNCPANSALGRNSAQQPTKGLEIIRTVTVNKPRAEVYAFWRQLENLPQFMKHLNRVVELDGQRSRWEARIPANLGEVTWEAQIVEEVENELLRWQSLPGADVDNAGEVRFKDAPGDRGTEVQAAISYRPPAGDLGKAVVSLFNTAFETMIKEDLRRFKRLLETGELPTIEGQPSGRKNQHDPYGSLPNTPVLEKEGSEIKQIFSRAYASSEE